MRITEKYSVTFDKMNITLQERYEKRSGKGRDSPLSGEFGYRDVSFHSTWKGVIDKIEKLGAPEWEVESIREYVEQIEKLKDEMTNLLKNNEITMN